MLPMSDIKHTYYEDVFYIMEDYFNEKGFGGELFACEDEFYDCEYQDVEYMKYLLPGDMFQQYKTLSTQQAQNN